MYEKDIINIFYRLLNSEPGILIFVVIVPLQIT